MDEEVNSWIRRTKFSHTVCHRLDSARLASIPFTIQSGRIAGAKTRPETASPNPRPEPTVVRLQRNPTTNKQRTVSPHPETAISDTFKEARSSQKRFSTPHPQRKEHEKKIMSKSFHKDSRGTKSPLLRSPGSRSPANTSPLRHFTSMKFHDKSKSRKDSAWSRYFDHGVGRVSSVETADEYTIDLSKLFLGLRFAHGAHSQLYHGNETLTDSSPAATTTEHPEAPVQQPSSNTDDGGVSQPFRTPEELVAKAIAPVKREYLRPPPSRPSNNNDSNNSTVGVENDDAAEAKSAPILKEKKSKRQIKRERRQEQKSPLHICPEVAKTGKVSACPYSDKCRFSHDLEAFKAEKPADIEGSCPFLVYEGPCPYGLACRFAGTHEDDVSTQTEKISRKSSELNFFNKDTQKLLWKNKMKFPKAEATLKLLGLKGHPKDKILVDKEENGEVVLKEPATDTKTDSNEAASDCSNKVEITPSISPEDDVVENNLADDIRPLKKAKSSIDEICSSQASNGSSVQGEVLDSNCDVNKSDPTADMVTDSDKSLKLHPREKKLIDFRDKLYLAPLTTVGNLPFRRVCKVLGADVTSGEMAMCTNLLQGQASEWALLRRHSSENLFGVQICGAYPDTVTKTVELIEQECSVDFIDINMGCPIDIVVNKGAGSALLTKPMRMKSVVEAASATVDIPITIKVRTAYFEGKNRIDSLIADIGNWGATAVTIHGRSRQQRYSKLADWDYIYQCVQRAPKSLQVLGNGDVFSYLDWNKHKTDSPELSTCMIARGALIKPWIFTEIKEQRHWDITSGERLDILKDYARFGLEHWGSDSKGVETTRHFLLEWLSYTCRYVPVGLLEIIPQRINWRPPSYYGRDDLETLMASDSAADWIRISEMLLGKVPAGFSFAPKHKSNAYDRAENG